MESEAIEKERKACGKWIEEKQEGYDGYDREDWAWAAWRESWERTRSRVLEEAAQLPIPRQKFVLAGADRDVCFQIGFDQGVTAVRSAIRSLSGVAQEEK